MKHWKRVVPGWIIAALGIGWMIWELNRHLAMMISQSGLGPALVDGVTIHKLGELMIVLPIIIPAINSAYWPADRLRQFAAGTRLIMPAGGILNLAAWFMIRDLVEWHLWCLMLFAASLAGPLIQNLIIRTAMKQQAASTADSDQTT